MQGTGRLRELNNVRDWHDSWDVDYAGDKDNNYDEDDVWVGEYAWDECNSQDKDDPAMEMIWGDDDDDDA